MAIEKDLLQVNKLAIWNHQKDALRNIAEYIREYNGKAFLVKMPTGTGKTGVFACLSRIVYPSYNYIIITPSKALKFQIITELITDFWDKINKPVAELPAQEIMELMPNNSESVIENTKGKHFILVTTIQALQQISADKKYAAVIKELKDRTDILVFDEGHKEPSYTWGDTVRAFQKPTVLFSATPYRNDYKIFNINKEKFYSLEHSLCVKQNILRELEIVQLKISPIGPSTFITELLNQIQKKKTQLEAQGIANPKVIIRCENEGDIKKIVAVLLKLKKRVVGIHDTFPDKSPYLVSVPDKTQQLSYDYFVHQYKLIEGIDNPDFAILALYSNFKSTRMLIQQIGRVLRNPGLKKDQFAFLFAVDGKRVQEEWQKYLEFDAMVNTTKKLFDVTDVLRVNKDVSTLYFSGTFRDLVDINNIELTKKILFQTKVNVFTYENDITFDELSVIVMDDWIRRDFFILKHEIPEENVLLILYIKYENSPLVKDGIFIEQTLALTYLNVQKDLIFYYDSELNNPLFQNEKLTPVTSEMLTNLYNQKRNITRLTLHNTDIGKQNLRSKELLAGAIETTAPGLADHSFFPSRLEGYVTENGVSQRRYVGFQYGRITDHSAKRISFEEYQNWIVNIKKQLKTVITGGRMHGFLKRFSSKVDPPADTTPVSILLDIDTGLLDQFLYGEPASDVVIDELCLSIVSNQFVLVVNGVSYTCLVDYITQRKRYVLTCPELDKNCKNIDENGSSLLTVINSDQAFRIVVSGNQYVYAYANFYKPGLNLISKKKELDITQLFHVHPCISVIKSEKGGAALPVAGGQWDKKTLFGLIARRAAGYGDASLAGEFTFDQIVCDDLSSEIADFIALDTDNKRIVFMHVKAGDSKLSASAFMEVCGQATKNLDYLTPYYQSRPDNNIKRWDENWTLKNIGIVKRIIVGTNSKTFWANYTKLIADPSVSREVWLVVGNSFDFPTFSKEINKRKIESIRPELIQLIYLLRSCWDGVSSVGAQLKIFC